MRAAIETAIKYRRITLFILIILILMGGYTYYMSPRQVNPDVNAPIAMVTTIYPGASPEDVERLVTRKIEDEIAEVEGFDYMESYSRNSVSVVVMRLVYGTDIDEAWSELRQKMEDVQQVLPEECQPVSINTDLAETAGIIVAMAGESYTYEELSDYAEDLKDQLSEVSGIRRFEIVGKQEKNLVVEVDHRKLNQYGMSLSQLIDLLRAQNIEIPSGKIEEGDTKINVRTSGTFRRVDDVENVIVAVSPDSGVVVKLSELADVYYDLADSNYKVKEGKDNAVLLTGFFQSNRNVVLIGKDVETTINAYANELPEDITFSQVLYEPNTVHHAVNDFAMNLIQGVLFVVIVVFIGMGFRNAIIVSTAIPSSIFITFGLMRFVGVSLHQISIAALIVSLGMLVDNAIVISDAIQVRIDKGEPRLRACVDGAREVAIPILTSTLTTIAAFLPFLLLNSIAGEYIVSLPLIVMSSLTASYFVALFVTPSMAYIYFKPSVKIEKEFRIRKAFDQMLKWGMRHNAALIVLILLAITSTAYAGMQLGLQFFPKADTDMFYMNVNSFGTDNIVQTERITEHISDQLASDPVVIGYTTAIGGGLPKFYYTIPNPAPSQDYAQVMVRVDLEVMREEGYERLTDYINHMQRELDEVVSAGKVTVKELEQAEPIGAPVRLRITGQSMDQLRAAAEVAKKRLADIPGATNIDDDFDDRIYEFTIVPDMIKSNAMGVTNYDIQNEVSIALRGREAGVLRQGKEEYPILVTSDIRSKSELENLMIRSQFTDNKILLKEIGNIHLASQYPVIKKHNRKLTVHVLSDVEDGYSSIDIQNALGEKLKQESLMGVAYEFDGEQQKIRENFGSVGEAAVLAMILVYMILLIQFKSFVQPLIILITVPLSVIGSTLGLYIFRQNLSFVAALGVVSLLGIVVNNAIVLIDFINYETKQGKVLEDACADAVGKRFRPIMLSTITTVMGLTPLIYSGSSLFMPMAIALMSGLMVSTLLTLVVIPVIYSIVMKRFRPRQIRRVHADLMRLKRSVTNG